MHKMTMICGLAVGLVAGMAIATVLLPVDNRKMRSTQVGRCLRALGDTVEDFKEQF